MWSDAAQRSRDSNDLFDCGDGSDMYRQMPELLRAAYRKDFNDRIGKGLALLPDAAKAGGEHAHSM
jgi:hypothetical protein